jgi:hypothetical protein
MNSILNNQQYIAHNIHINIIKEEDIAIENQHDIHVLSFHHGI